MAPRKKKNAAKTRSKAPPARKAAAAKRKSVKPARKAAVAKKAGAAKSKRAIRPLDLSAFPSESVNVLERWLCLACIAEVFTRHLALAPRTAQLEIQRYTPSVAELYSPAAARPWFERSADQSACPYCGSGPKSHTRLVVYRIESGKATDALRRELIQSLPQTGNRFVILEEKATQQHAFYEWLEKISAGLDLENPVWLRDVSRHYLGRKEPRTDWESQFHGIHAIRRSRRLESGWEVDGGRLFLAPMLFDELLLVQYLVSRSHKAGGLTLEGRYTLPELFARLRNAGYLRAAGIRAQTPADALEELVVHLGGGEAAVKFYHIVDRREYLEKAKNLKMPAGRKRAAR